MRGQVFWYSGTEAIGRGARKRVLCHRQIMDAGVRREGVRRCWVGSVRRVGKEGRETQGALGLTPCVRSRHPLTKKTTRDAFTDLGILQC